MTKKKRNTTKSSFDPSAILTKYSSLASMFHPWLLLLILICIFSHHLPLSFSQSNIEIFFPFVIPPPPPLPNFPIPSQQAAPIVPLTKSSSHYHSQSHQASKNQLVETVVATMIIAIVISGIILFFLRKLSSSRHPRVQVKTGGPVPRKPILRKPELGGTKMVNLKPLHWDHDQVKNADHSMGLDKAHNKGSNGYNGDITEALFGYVATDRKSPRNMKISSNISNSPPPRIVILDPHKSQITGTVIRSLCITRNEILDAFLQGKRTLSIDTLEKLAKIAPNEEEATLLLDFDGNPTKLADAEFFLYHLFKAIPSPFHRLKAMLLRSDYEAKILHLKESLKTIELGCNEVQMHKLLWKLLKALNERGVKALRQRHIRSDLLKLTVENVVRSKGKISMANDRNLDNVDIDSYKGTILLNEEKENEYYNTMIGLQVLIGDLTNVKYSNAKKAASIDYTAFNRARVDEIWKLLEHINGDEGNGFVRDMEGFLNEAEDELEMVRNEETRVLELVKTIMNSCIQTGGFGDHDQVFVVVNDFLALVDQVCVEIAKDLKE